MEHDEALTSPVSLSKLMTRYDGLVDDLNRSTTHPITDDSSALQHRYYLLRLICSILTEILETSRSVDDPWRDLRTQLRQTAERCRLLESFLALESSPELFDEENENTSSFISIQVENCVETNEWNWQLGAEKHHDLSQVLTMSKAELASEEATLVQMASTPIPTKEGAVSLPVDGYRFRLLNRIANEWQ